MDNPFGDLATIDPTTSLQPQAERSMIQDSDRPARVIDSLPEESKQKAIGLAQQIDPHNHQAIILYGTQAQSKLLNFSHSMLDHVQNKDVGEIGEILTRINVETTTSKSG